MQRKLTDKERDSVRAAWVAILNLPAQFMPPIEEAFKVLSDMREHGTTDGKPYVEPEPPIPPEPQYRPFANAAEFEPHFRSMVKERSIEDYRTIITSFNDKGVWLSGASIATKYTDAFGFLEFADGTPFGVKASE